MSKPIYFTVFGLETPPGNRTEDIRTLTSAEGSGRDTLTFMQITDVYLGLGQEAFGQLIRGISIGKLKTYQIYEGFKVRAHLPKVNTEVSAQVGSEVLDAHFRAG